MEEHRAAKSAARLPEYNTNKTTAVADDASGVSTAAPHTALTPTTTKLTDTTTALSTPAATGLMSLATSIDTPGHSSISLLEAAPSTNIEVPSQLRNASILLHLSNMAAINALSVPEESAFMLQLPPEMVEHVAVYLPPSDLLALRLTCRDLNAKTFHYFGKQHFTTKCFMLSRQSLQRLVDISRHEGLNQYMETLVLGAEALPRTPPADISTEKLLAYRSFLDEQEHLKTGGLGSSMLSTSLSHLPNCRSIAIFDCCENNGYYSDIPRCYGATTIFEQTGMMPAICDGDYRSHNAPNDSLSRLFMIALQASSLSSTPLRSLLVIPHRPADAALPPEAFHLPSWQIPQTRSVLSRLHQLDLAFTIEKEGAKSRETWLQPIVDFIAFALVLEILSSGFYTAQGNFAGGGNLVSMLSRSPSQPSLRVASLGSLRIDGLSLVNFLLRSRGSLEEVILNKVDIEDMTWQEVFLEFGRHLSLASIYLRDLSQQDEEVRFLSLDPTELPPKEERNPDDCCERSSTIDHVGRSGMRVFLDSLQTRMVVG